MTDDEAQRLAGDLRRTLSNFVRAIRQDTGTNRSAQSEALDLLDRLGPMNVADMANNRGVTHQTMRLIVAQMDGAGLVQQVPHPSDGRSRMISITAAGSNVLAQERKTRTVWIAEAISTRLSPAERDLLRAAAEILDRLTMPTP